MAHGFQHICVAVVIGTMLLAAPSVATCPVAGKTFGGSWFNEVWFSFAFGTNGLLDVTTGWNGNFPSTCANMTITSCNETSVVVPGLDTNTADLSDAGALCVANWLSSNGFIMAPTLDIISSNIGNCGGSVLNSCSLLRLNTVVGPVLLLSQSLDAVGERSTDSQLTSLAKWKMFRNKRMGERKPKV